METLLGLLFWGAIWVGLPWVVFLILRAIWRAFSLDAAARKAGELTGRIENAYKDGRGRS